MGFEKGKHNYDSLPEDHDLVLRYRPSYLNRGGEHLVYTVEEHPNIVIKASTYKIKDSVINVTSYDLGKDDQALKLEAMQNYFDEIKRKNEEVGRLRKFFGKDHTLRERRYLMKVPVTYELLREIFSEDYFKRTLPESAKDITDVWTHVIVQEYTKTSEDPDKLSLTYGFFIEDQNPNLQEYQKLTSSSFRLNKNDFDETLFLKLQDRSKNKSISKLIQLSNSDEGLKEQLTSFVITAIRYTEETGQILALAGEDNVLFYKEDNKWNYLLLDALPNSPEPIFHIMLSLEQKLSNSIELSDDEKEFLKRGINFVRIINGLALSLGLSVGLKISNIFSDVDILSIINEK